MDRRAFLRRIGASAALLPLLPEFHLPRAHAAPAPPIRRLALVYSSNGTVREKWVPKVEGSGLVLSEILAPLEKHKDQLLVVDGLGYSVCEKGEKTGHYGGMNAALTGSPPKIVDKAEGRSLATGPSIDQVIGASFGSAVPFRSIECGVRVDTYAATVAATAYRGALDPILPENDPRKILARVFGAAPSREPDPAAEARLRDRRSLLDTLTKDLARVRARLAVPDQPKFDAHLEAFRDLERRLDGAAATCSRPAIPALDLGKNDQIPQIGRAQIDLLVAAFACDRTRVGTIQYGRAGATHRLSWLGPEFLSDPDNGPNDSTSGIHGLAHNEANPTSRAKLARCHAWYAGEVAYLVDRLRAIPEGTGTMADSTLVVWFNELGTGNHSLRNTPWVLVGALGGAIRTGRLVTAPGVAHNKLLIAIARAFGLDVETFGDPDVKGALPGVLTS
jgi:hypothetical protein